MLILSSAGRHRIQLVTLGAVPPRALWPYGDPAGRALSAACRMAAHNLPVSAAKRARFEALLRGGGVGARITFTLVAPDGAVTTGALDAARHAGLVAAVWAAAHAPASGAVDPVASTRAACNALAAAGAREGGTRVGLTPDWLIAAACDILGLARPSPQQPVVRGLLDPCTNRRAPRALRRA